MAETAKATLLAELRSRIRRMEGLGGEAGGGVLPFGVAGLDAGLPDGGLPLGCLHEVTAEDAGAGTAFAAALLARLAAARGAPVLWVVRGRDLHAAGLAAYGLTPERLIAVRAEREADALWALEEALRCNRLAAVLGEVRGLDLTASRRLQLAAEAGGVTGLLLQTGEGRAGAASAAVTRWRVAPAPSLTDGEPGVGAPCWRLELLRCRGGRPGSWLVGWRDGALVGVEAPAEAEGFAAVA
ncbi:ImuA family protein [Azospirillum sp.]|uniref:ImuA family protein n=1 Tax=Azospirillum sp. TaxID=34012 RepID=UPI003D74B59A